MSAAFQSKTDTENLSVVIPTYRREKVLIETIEALLRVLPAPAEIIVVDQTPRHELATESRLMELEEESLIRWFKMPKPSITKAMNHGLRLARCPVVLFLDDDVIPDFSLIAAHARAQAEGHKIVAGQVLQPGESPLSPIKDGTAFRFNSTARQFIKEFIGCNFSVNRRFALALQGFDENFVRVAYRYEAEFADRALTVGEPILFEPEASIRHLKAESGGTRSFGRHLTTLKPSHAVGAYYFLLRARNISGRFIKLLGRPLGAVKTRHHARHPWWIPATLVSEILGFFWAVFLCLRGPRLIRES